MLIEFNILEKYKIKPYGVMHIGMHKAEEYPIYKKYGVKNIIFVEANEQLAYSWDCDDDDCYIVHAAISDIVEIVTFNITNNGESSSILSLGEHSKIYPHIVNTHSVIMKTTTIDNVDSVVGLGDDGWNILNLDIQGAELKALKGIKKWNNIDAIFTEINFVEMYMGCSLEPELTKFLNDKGFEKVEQVDTGCGWGDALYIKK